VLLVTARLAMVHCSQKTLSFKGKRGLICKVAGETGGANPGLSAWGLGQDSSEDATLIFIKLAIHIFFYV